MSLLSLSWPPATPQDRDETDTFMQLDCGDGRMPGPPLISRSYNDFLTSYHSRLEPGSAVHTRLTHDWLCYRHTHRRRFLSRRPWTQAAGAAPQTRTWWSDQGAIPEPVPWAVSPRSPPGSESPTACTAPQSERATSTQRVDKKQTNMQTTSKWFMISHRRRGFLFRVFNSFRTVLKCLLNSLNGFSVE